MVYSVVYGRQACRNGEQLEPKNPPKAIAALVTELAIAAIILVTGFLALASHQGIFHSLPFLNQIPFQVSITMIALSGIWILSTISFALLRNCKKAVHVSNASLSAAADEASESESGTASTETKPPATAEEPTEEEKEAIERFRLFPRFNRARGAAAGAVLADLFKPPAPTESPKPAPAAPPTATGPRPLPSPVGKKPSPRGPQPSAPPVIPPRGPSLAPPPPPPPTGALPPSGTLPSATAPKGRAKKGGVVSEMKAGTPLKHVEGDAGESAVPQITGALVDALTKHESKVRVTGVDPSCPPLPIFASNPTFLSLHYTKMKGANAISKQRFEEYQNFNQNDRRNRRTYRESIDVRLEYDESSVLKSFEDVPEDHLIYLEALDNYVFVAGLSKEILNNRIATAINRLDELDKALDAAGPVKKDGSVAVKEAKDAKEEKEKRVKEACEFKKYGKTYNLLAFKIETYKTLPQNKRDLIERVLNDQQIQKLTQKLRELKEASQASSLDMPKIKSQGEELKVMMEEVYRPLTDIQFESLFS